MNSLDDCFWPRHLCRGCFHQLFVMSNNRARAEFFNSTASVKHDVNATHLDDWNLPFYLGIYSGESSSPLSVAAWGLPKVMKLYSRSVSGLTVAAVLFGYTRSLAIFHGLVRSAQNLHNSMFSAVIRTPVHFFDVNPIGECKETFMPPGKVCSLTPCLDLQAESSTGSLKTLVRLTPCYPLPLWTFIRWDTTWLLVRLWQS